MMTDMCLQIDSLPQGVMLLPLQGVFAAINLPRALPWAMGCCPFGACFQMHIYDDHLEIWNEGELPLGYTEETLMSTHSSKPRNRNIANAMFKAGFIDTWGRGYMKIRDGFEAAGIPMPKVQNFCGGVQVSVQRTTFMKMTNVGYNVGNNVGNMSDIQLTDRQLKICRLIKEYPHISAKGLSEVLAVVSRTIERDLSELQKAGFIIREGSKIAGHWVLLKEITGTAISNSPITIGELSPELIYNGNDDCCPQE